MLLRYLFCDRFTLTKFCSADIPAGMFPESWLLYNFNSCNSVKHEILDGISPMSLLPDRFKCVSSRMQWKTSGMGPSNSLNDKFKSFRQVNCAKESASRYPHNMLLERSRVTSLLINPNRVGKFPKIRFQFSLRNVHSSKPLMLSGSLPVHPMPTKKKTLQD